MIPDNHLVRMSPADIIAFEATNTLAVISTWSTEELIRIGWIGNPIVDILYSMTSAGVWIARTNASGQETEANSSSINTQTQNAVNFIRAFSPTAHVSTITPTSSTIAAYIHRRYVVVPIVLVGGALADNVVIPALAGYYGVFRPLALIANTTDTYTLTFQDEDDAAASGLLAGVINVACTEYIAADLSHCGVVYKPTDNKALEVDVSGGAGVEILALIGEYWYET